MIPIAMIYNTPEDAAAEIKYLENRKYPISYVEMGEEPDGHYMVPEDYAALCPVCRRHCTKWIRAETGWSDLHGTEQGY